MVRVSEKTCSSNGSASTGYEHETQSPDDDNDDDDVFRGWTTYPLSLPDFDPLLEDGHRYIHRLEELSGSLFSSKPAIQVLDANQENQFVAHVRSLEDPVAIERHFQADLPDFRLISIARKHSLLNFKITKDLLCKILTRHQVTPRFLDLLFGFRATEELSEKGFGGLSACGPIKRHYDICYQLRYMERNCHTQGKSWSERQIGVYHSFSSRPGSRRAVMILLHAMFKSLAQTRLEDVFSSGHYREETATSQLRLHLLIFSTYLDGWRWYMDDLGMSCLRLENEGFTAELKSKADRSLSFRTLQELRNMESKFFTATTILKATIDTLQELETICNDLESSRCQNESMPYLNTSENSCKEIYALKVLSQKCHAYIASVEVMQNRIAKLIELLADGLSQKTQATSADISNSLLILTQGSVDDNVTVRVVTIITLIYLPTQFVATFFGTNFVVFQAEQRTIQFAKDFWIFIAIAVPLTILTLSIWLVATRRQKHGKQKAARLEENKDQLEEL